MQIISGFDFFSESGERNLLEGIPTEWFKELLERRVNKLEAPKQLKNEVITNLMDILSMGTSSYLKTNFTFSDARGCGWWCSFFVEKTASGEINMDYSWKLVKFQLAPLKMIVQRSGQNLFSSWVSDEVIQKPAIITPEIQRMLDSKFN